MVTPEGSRVIEVRLTELRQLFHSIDPSPFRERDLDPRAAEFIVDWASDLPADAPLALAVYLERRSDLPDEAAAVRESVREYFRSRAASTRRSLRDLFRRGRLSLAIGLAFLGGSIALGDVLAEYFSESTVAELIRESLLIGGWVAMWRPLEVFLYDWWPIRAEARLFDRLSAMPVRMHYTPRDGGPADPSHGQ